MHKFVEWTHNHNVNLWYNTIRNPEHLALWNWEELHNVYDNMNSFCKAMPNFQNKDKYEHLVEKQVKSWYEKMYL